MIPFRRHFFEDGIRISVKFVIKPLTRLYYFLNSKTDLPGNSEIRLVVYQRLVFAPVFRSRDYG